MIGVYLNLLEIHIPVCQESFSHGRQFSINHLREDASHYMVLAAIYLRDPVLEKLYLLQEPGPWEAVGTAEACSYQVSTLELGIRNLSSCNTFIVPSTDKLNIMLIDKGTNVLKAQSLFL